MESTEPKTNHLTLKEAIVIVIALAVMAGCFWLALQFGGEGF